MYTGNSSMINWKLGAFFIVGLMLFAAVFSHAAMAADDDGKGRVEIRHGVRDNADTLNWNFLNQLFATEPLYAGTTHNMLEFTYTAFTDVAGDGQGGDDTANEADANDTPINMAGGKVRIAFPSDWKVSAKYIRVYDGLGADNALGGSDDNADTIIYETDGDGKVVEANSPGKGRVAFTADKHITVDLGSAWGGSRSDVGRKLVIIFGDVTAGIPALNGAPSLLISFNASSSAKNGTLELLAPLPKVAVEGIITENDHWRNPLKSKVEITPALAYKGYTNVRFEVVFTAPGPILPTSRLYFYIPAAVQIDTEPDILGVQKPNNAADILKHYTLSARGGATFASPIVGSSVDLVDIHDADAPAAVDGSQPGWDLGIDVTMDKGQQVVLSWTAPQIYTSIAGASDPAQAANQPENSSAIFVKVAGAEKNRLAEHKGGIVRDKKGSGTVALSPDAVEAGAQHRNIAVTYTAVTDLSGFDIEVAPLGIVLDAPNKLQNTTSTGYGYVSGSLSDSLTVSSDGMKLKWSNITLKKGKTVKATIKRVNIVADPGEYDWTTGVGPTGTTPLIAVKDDALTGDEDETPTLSVTKTSGDAVGFSIVGASEFPAGSESTIVFRFTATNTAIRDGNVSLTIPAALGSAPTIKEKTPGRVKAEVSKGLLGKDQGSKPGVSGQTITVGVKRLAVGGTVTITYGLTGEKEKVKISDVSGDVKVTGHFKASSASSTRTAGTVTVKVGNIVDGVGTATLSPGSIEAGSNHRAVEVVFTAAGTMDGGAVSLEIPTGWGDMQNDPTKRNYLTTRGSGVDSLDVGAKLAIAKLGKLAKGDVFRFVLGGGTGGTNNGVEVQDTVGTAQFVIKSDGDGDEVFDLIKNNDLEWKDREKIRNPDKTGKIYKDAPGILQIKVTSALDGTGKATVDVTSVRAAADNVKLVFTYKPIQTIEDGTLTFTVPASWSKPQVEEAGTPGYTEVAGVGLDTATDDDKYTVTIPIFNLDKTNEITITYGAADTGRAVAAAAVGSSAFEFQMKGHADGTLTPLNTQPTVTIQPQASGKGTATVVVDGDALHAGDTNRKFTVVYKAAGQMVAGKVRLTIPTGWTAPTADNVTVAGMTPTFDMQMVMVEGVNLLAGGMVTFVYTGDVLPKSDTEPGATVFAVASHGGLTADAYAAVSAPKDPKDGSLTVDVGHSRAGSGSGTVSPRIVEAGATGVNIQFTYTAAGWTDSPREFRVQVPTGWSAPTKASSALENKGTYTVVHRSGGAETTTSVEKLNPIGRDMIARVKQGGLEVEAGDEIIFTYQNADTPATTEVSAFKLLFDGKAVDANVSVRVQDSTPSQLSLSSAGTVSADEGAVPLAITVGLQDAAGKAAALTSDTMVTLTSSSAGTFAATADGAGTESLAVTIAGGDVSTLVYYMDGTAGTATITASAPNLTSASHAVTVTTTVVALTAGSVIVSPALAMAGNTVVVSALGTAGQAATFSVGSIVTAQAMTETTAIGAYSGTFTVDADLHADGVYDVTVNLGGLSETATGALTLDSTMPTVTASASPATVANGDTVTISVTITDPSAISSVMADVSALDSTQTSVALTKGADGSYSASITISADNTAADGSKSITVTATDAAGNSGMGTATVMLDNTLTYTSTIPAGTSLFHVPLDVEGLDTVGNLKTMLGASVNLLIVYDSATGTWNSRSDDVPITADLGIVVSASAAIEATFTGESWGGVSGTATLNLTAGSNLVGLPLNDPRVTNVSDIISLFAAGVVTQVGVLTDTTLVSVSTAGGPGDSPVSGDAAYLITATADATAALVGTGWSNDAAGTAPMGLVSYQVEGQTPVLDVTGSVVDEITGTVQQGFRVKVKNLSTKAALNKVTSTETAAGYNMTFVDLKDGHAGRVGDVLEISADSPNPLIGVQPVRHIVTVDDVKANRIELEALIAYEIPAETELLRNYPNPFNPETWIPYRLAEDADVSLTIYDVNGELVRTIDIGYQNAAVYESRAKAIYWDGRNRFGEQVSSGVYFYSLSAGDFSATRKMVILK